MRKLCLLIVLFTVSACQSKQVIVPAVVHNVSTTEEVVVEKAHLPIIGEVEPMFLKRKSNVHLRLSVPEKTKAAKPLKWMLKWAEKCSAPYFP